jgi:hypothetical protein
MLMLNLSPNNFPEDAGSGSSLDDRSTYDMLGDDTTEDNDQPIIDKEDTSDKAIPPVEGGEDEEEEHSEEKEPTEEEKAAKELEELEAELNEDVDDDKLELVTPVRRREILAKYPNLFKDFPYIEKAYYREQEFTNLFPTINEAKSAVESATVLSRFERSLADGDTSTILSAVKQMDPDAFNQLVDNYLPNLNKVDPQAHLHVVGNVVKNVVVEMVNEGRNSNNDALKNAAQIVYQFIFGKSRFEPVKNLAQPRQSNDAEVKLNRERQEFAEQRFQTARSEINSKINNQILNTISGNLDPRGQMTEYVKKHAQTEAVSTLKGLVEKDPRFRVMLDKFWESAAKENYSPESMRRIQSAYLAKSKTLLPNVIRKARVDALRGMGKRVKDEPEAPVNNSERRSAPRSNSGESAAPRSGGKIDYRGDPRKEAKKIPTGMSTKDFLMSD